jgi:E3 ubiquitin-protein ligase TRIP12
MPQYSRPGLIVLLTALNEAIKADHGFNVESRAIHDLLDIMSEYDPPTRRSYLQFITGSPKLPIGGTFLGLVDVSGLS